jgi:hypothetical protein
VLEGTKSKMEDAFDFHIFIPSFLFNWFTNIDLEGNNGKDSNVICSDHHSFNDYNFDKGSLLNLEGNQTMRKRK